MPQEFQVLRCVNCEKFQVHQTKKSKKWICKVCGEKQSYMRIYFTGSAPQCRSIVQENNFKAGEIRTAKILAESPNSYPQNDDIKEEYDDDEHDSYNRASKRLKSEVERFISAEDLKDSTCLLEDENSFFNESCGTSEYYNPKDITKENVDSIEKQPLTTAGSNPNKILQNIVHDTCGKSDSCLKSEIPKIKPYFVKNRGFQKILKAAEKFS